MTAQEKEFFQRLENKMDIQYNKYDKISEVVIRHDEMIKNINNDILENINPKIKMVQKHEDKINFLWKVVFIGGGFFITTALTIILIIRTH